MDARLLLDADVPQLLAPALRERGYDAVHVRELGLERIPDLEVLETAVSQRRVVLSHNIADYMELASTFGVEGRHHFGIIVSAQRPVGQLLTSIQRALSQRDAASLADAVFWLPR